jgi:hypothetical protein
MIPRWGVAPVGLATLLAAESLAQPFSPAPPSLGQELVITNQDLALVTDTRRFDLAAGAVALFWPGAPSTVKIETWTVTTPAEVQWLGLSSPSAEGWLSSLVGRKVRVRRPGGETADADVLEVHGPSPEQVLFREGEDLVFGEPHAAIVVPAEGASGPIPAGVTLRLASERAGRREITSRYLVASLGWEASYSLLLSGDERNGRLEGVFAIQNGTGSTFAPRRLRLVAGTLKVESPITPRPIAAMAVRAAPADSTAASESRVYEVSSPAPLSPGRTLLPLISSVVATSKRYLVRGSYWTGRTAEPQKLPVSVGYRVGTSHLGKALPGGIVRVYSEEGTFFAGEDRIGNTLEKTDVDIEASEAFDLAATRQQVAFREIGPRESESDFEITLTSRKPEDVTVLVRDDFPGEWTILQSSAAPTRRGASTAEFAVPVRARSTAKLTYRVRVRTAG